MIHCDWIFCVCLHSIVGEHTTGEANSSLRCIQNVAICAKSVLLKTLSWSIIHTNFAFAWASKTFLSWATHFHGSYSAVRFVSNTILSDNSGCTDLCKKYKSVSCSSFFSGLWMRISTLSGWSVCQEIDSNKDWSLLNWPLLGINTSRSILINCKWSDFFVHYNAIY